MPIDRKVQSDLGTSVRKQTRTLVPEILRHWSRKPLVQFRRKWRRLGLSGQFLALATVAFVCLMTLASVIQNELVFRNIMRNSAEVGSIYMRGIVQPYLRPLETGGELTAGEREELDLIIQRSGLADQMHEVRIWLPDGTIAYSTNRENVGRQIDSASVKRALQGETVFEHGYIDHDGSKDTAPQPDDMIEIYMPLADEDGRIVLVGEFYQDYRRAYEIAVRTRSGNWAVRIAFSVVGIGLLFLLVRHAHRTIVSQQRIIRQNYANAHRMAVRNRNLRDAADQARRDAALANEELLNRVGSEIHDGPIQLLSSAVLGADAGEPAQGNSAVRGKFIAAAIEELRTISAGLILPEILELAPEEAFRLAVVRHELATGTEVETRIENVPASLSQGLKACVYRIIQECLNNSARHAEGKGQRVEVSADDRFLAVTVGDSGPGIASAVSDDRPRLGLLGVRNRVQAYGGTVEVATEPGGADGVGGTKVTATLPLDGDLNARTAGTATLIL